jgi:hypothetical protein
MLIEKEWHHVKRVLQDTLDHAFAIAPDATTEFDSLLSHDDINALGYARNFPHLTCLMCSIEAGELPRFARGERTLGPDLKQLDADLALLPATCYKVYLSLKGAELADERVESCIARCFRHEDKALDRYRAFNFTMKEYVYLGTAEGALAHLEEGHRRLTALFDALGLDISCELANDPFFDASGSVAKLSALNPTKRELVFDAHAVSSLNYHRNYFGEKFQIRHRGELVHTSCVAFGLERWISMLKDRFADAAAALDALTHARIADGEPV